jgi:hypothetical protein
MAVGVAAVGNIGDHSGDQTRRIEGNAQTATTRPHTFLANISHPSKALRDYTLAIDIGRSGQVLKTRTHEQQHLTTATDDQQQLPTSQRGDGMSRRSVRGAFQRITRSS